MALELKVIKEKIEGLQLNFAKVGYPVEVFNREVGFALQALQKNDTLRECSLQSIRTAVYNVALTGISLNPTLGYAYLVPRKLKKTDPHPTCILDVSYVGKLQIAKSNGGIKDVLAAECWYEHDVFEVIEGSDPKIIHKLNYGMPRGKLMGAYIVVEMTSGIKRHKVMGFEDIEKIRKLSPMADKGAWKNFYAEQAIKVVTKRASKTWAHSKQMDIAQKQSDIAEAGESGIHYDDDDIMDIDGDDIPIDQSDMAPPMTDIHDLWDNKEDPETRLKQESKDLLIKILNSEDINSKELFPDINELKYKDLPGIRDKLG
jgi:phage RecT family recombinase